MFNINLTAALAWWQSINIVCWKSVMVKSSIGWSWKSFERDKNTQSNKFTLISVSPLGCITHIFMEILNNSFKYSSKGNKNIVKCHLVSKNLSGFFKAHSLKDNKKYFENRLYQTTVTRNDTHHIIQLLIVCWTSPLQSSRCIIDP